MNRTSTQLLATLLAGALVVTGCTQQQGGAASEVPFAAGSYPVEAPAECAVDEAGNPKIGLERIEAPEEHKVIFRLCAPDPTFLEKLAVVSFGVNDSGYLSAATADGSILRSPNGTGPLALDAWSSELQTLTMRAFDGYWGTKAVSDQIIFQWQGDAAARSVLLRAGTVDGIDNVVADDIPGFSEDPNYLVLTRDPIAINYLGVNGTIAPFDDVRVRQAVAMSISSQRLVENFYPAGSVPATHFVPCVIRYGCEGSDWYEVDRPKARALLAEAGYPDGLTVPLHYRGTASLNTPDPLGIATDIQAQLAEVGITVVLTELESTTFSALANAGELDGFFVSGWIADFLDPVNYYYRYFVTSPERFGGRVDAIAAPLEQAAVTENSPKRAALFTEVNEAMREAALFTPLGHGSSALAWSAAVTGAKASPLGFEDFARVAVPGKNSATFVTIEEPPSLYCADEVTPNTLRYCYNIFETLYKVESGGSASVPSLAETCVPSEGLTVWTCELRKNVVFHNGARFDAGDVRDSYAAQWDCALPTHVGRTGAFDNWGFISDFLNPEACESE